MTGFRRVKHFALILIFLFFFAGVVQGLEFGDIALVNSDKWVVAGENIDIEVININNSVGIQSVGFELLDSGSEGIIETSLDSVNPYTTGFYSEESGIADIRITVNYIFDGYEYSVSKIYGQYIDHGPMYSVANPERDYEVIVNNVTTIKVYALDRLGNRIDSRREADQGGTPEYFTLISSPETSEFWNGTGYSNDPVTSYVDSEGYASTRFRVSEFAGSNIVNIIPSGDIDSRIISITGISNGEPSQILVYVSPSSGEPPYIPADDKSSFIITYQLLDAWGNPAGNRTIYISPDDEYDSPDYRTSNSIGLIEFSYGPKAIKGIYTLVATSVDNESVSATTRLSFVSTAPRDMLLTANPQVMPSHDVDSDFRAEMRAKVIDEMGNPVAGESVSFSIIDGIYPSSQVAPPFLESTSAVSDQDGYAIVGFVPGEFETDWNSPVYSKEADASCRVKALWLANDSYIDLEWKNYPYLSVQTNVTPETVPVNGTVEVEIKLTGDGWALQPDPVDVMLVADRSGSMLKEYPDRMVSLMDALKAFAGEMNEGKDRLGLISFGTLGRANIFDYYYDYWAGYDESPWDWPRDDGSYIEDHYPGNGKYYSNYSSIDKVLTLDFSDFDEEVDLLVPYGGTPMRKGVYDAIKHIRDNGRSDAVKAVIVLSDGDYNYYGDPLARGDSKTTIYEETDWWGRVIDPWDYGDYYYFDDLNSSEQNMSAFANFNNIKIYSIAYGSDLSAVGNITLENLAKSTGGEYYHAPDGEELEGIYKDIAGELKTLAGVDTEMELMFSNVEINNVTVSNENSEILRYVYDEVKSTSIASRYGNGTCISEHIDQSAWWSQNASLHFDVGTVYLNQTWQAKFLLRVLKPGNINLFNDTSFISFNGGIDSLSLPDTYVTSVADLNSTGMGLGALLDLSGFEVKNSESMSDRMEFNWDLYYDGSHPVTQTLEYLNPDEGTWNLFYETEMPWEEDNPVTTSHNYEWDVYNMPPGEYSVRLKGTSYDSNDDYEYLSQPISIGASSGAYIKIE